MIQGLPCSDQGFRLREELRRRSQVIRNLRTENRRLSRLAHTDSLTGIANRAAFRAKLNDSVREAASNGRSLSLLILDVDEFFAVNNRFGHPVGDQVLRKIADTLRSTIRDSDFVARLAGDEFVVLLPETDRDVAEVIAERIRNAVAEVRWPKAPITVSIGVACFDGSGLNARRLYQEADQALYQAKNDGRNRVDSSQLSNRPVKHNLTRIFRPNRKFPPTHAIPRSKVSPTKRPTTQPLRITGT
jgi:diguanylate cyclase (GGDEF)-like protein